MSGNLIDASLQPAGGAPPANYYRRALPAFCWLVALWLLCFRLGDFPLMEPDEGRNAEVSREMLNSGSWLVPTLDGLPYLDKPAFFFRSVAISMSIFGLNETAARLPAVLCGVAILAMLFGFCRRHYGEPAASLAVLVAATAPFFFAFSRLVIMDTMLGMFVCASIFSACLAEEAGGRTRRLCYLASAAAAGCGTMVKGPIGFLIPALVVSVFNLVDGRRGAIRRCFAPVNIAVFLAVVLPWFVALCLRHPNFLYYGLLEESWRRFTTAGRFGHTEPFYYYLLVVIAGMFPWSLLLPEPILFAWKHRARWTSTDRLFVVWTLVTMTFFSVSRAKQPAYVLSAVIALAALLGRFIAHALNQPGSSTRRLIFRSTIALALVYALVSGAAVLVSFGSYFPGGEAASATAVVAARLAAAFSGVLVAASVAITSVAVVAFWRRSVLLAVISFALFSICVMTAGFPALETYTRIRSARDLADALVDLPEGTEIACFHCFPASVAFYQRRLLPVFDTGGTPEQVRSNYLLFLWRRGGFQSDMVLDVNGLDAWLATKRGPVFVVANRTGRHWLGTMAAARGLPVREVAPEWWGFLIPARGGD